MFWSIVSLVLVVLLAVFHRPARQYPLATLLFLATVVYLIWRSYTLFAAESTDTPTDDLLVWKILGATLALIAVVGGLGAWLERRRKGSG